MPEQNSKGCQAATHRAGDLPPAYAVTWRTSSGGTFTEHYCPSCVSRRADEIEAEGGRVIAAKGLEPPKPLVELQPVGLDALVVGG